MVDKNTRNVLQIEYPSDIDEFNKILGTSEGKGSLLKDLGIILNSESKVFTNPEPIINKKLEQEKVIDEIKTIISDYAKTVELKPVSEILPITASIEIASEKKKQTKKKSSTKKAKPAVENKSTAPIATNLFAGLFD